MVTSASVRVTIKTQGQTRVLASLFERHNGPYKGDLILNFRPGLRSRSTDKPIQEADYAKEHGTPILEQRCSIHQSRESTEGINVITYVQRLGVGEPVIQRQHTAAIKSGDRFAPIFIRRFGQLKGIRYDLNKNTGRNLSLGHINTERFTLVMGMLVSAPTLSLSANEDDYNMTDIVFTHFRITVLWSFVPLPAYLSGMFAVWRTQDPRTTVNENERQDNQITMRGFNAQETINKFKIFREFLKTSMLQTFEVDLAAEEAKSSVDMNVPNVMARFSNDHGYYKRGILL
jgi:hypothetical protein